MGSRRVSGSPACAWADGLAEGSVHPAATHLPPTTAFPPRSRGQLRPVAVQKVSVHVWGASELWLVRSRFSRPQGRPLALPRSLLVRTGAQDTVQGAEAMVPGIGLLGLCWDRSLPPALTSPRPSDTLTPRTPLVTRTRLPTWTLLPTLRLQSLPRPLREGVALPRS